MCHTMGDVDSLVIVILDRVCLQHLLVPGTLARRVKLVSYYLSDTTVYL